MGDAYLEGLRETWITGNKISQELGHIDDWAIYRSALPESGDFNLLLVVKFASTEDLAPNKARYEEFMEEFTEEMADRTTEYAQKNYPGMRTITGEYRMRFSVSLFMSSQRLTSRCFSRVITRNGVVC